MVPIIPLSGEYSAHRADMIHIDLFQNHTRINCSDWNRQDQFFDIKTSSVQALGDSKCILCTLSGEASWHIVREQTLDSMESILGTRQKAGGACLVVTDRDGDRD